MAVPRTVSFKDNQFAEMMKRGINPTQAAQMGADLCLQGGIDSLKNLNDMQERLEAKDIKIEQLNKKIDGLREEVAFLRPQVAKTAENGQV